MLNRAKSTAKNRENRRGAARKLARYAIDWCITIALVARRDERMAGGCSASW